jgi:hypothetical protein
MSVYMQLSLHHFTSMSVHVNFLFFEKLKNTYNLQCKQFLNTLCCKFILTIFVDIKSGTVYRFTDLINPGLVKGSE